MELAIRYNRSMRLLAGLLGLGPRSSGVRIDGDHIDVRMGWAFHASFRIEDVERAERLDHLAWWWGQGVHGWRGKVVVNGSHQGLVVLYLRPGVQGRAPMRFQMRELILSLEDPDALLAVLDR